MCWGIIEKRENSCYNSNKGTDDWMNVERQAELKRKETLEAIDKLCLLDDNLMTLAFDRNIDATELVLNIIL